MNWTRYKSQLAQDLPRWVAAGWVSAEAQTQILGDVEARTPPHNAAPWLALTGIVLGGIAIIALIADNWGLVPRLGKLAMLLVLFWAALGGAIWTDARGRAWAVNALAVLGALLFAASLGLIGQSLNMPGDPADTALYGALGGFALCFAARSSGAGMVGLVLASVWYVSAGDGLIRLGTDTALTRTDGIALVLLAFTAGAASACKSRILAHAGLAAAGPYLLTVFVSAFGDGGGPLAAAAVWGAVAAAAAARAAASAPGARTLLGWSAWQGNFAFALAGFDYHDMTAHRVLWLGLALATLALGAGVKSGWSMAAGIVSLVLSGAILLMDMGVELTAAAAIFALAAAGAGVLAWALRQPKKDAGQ